MASAASGMARGAKGRRWGIAPEILGGTVSCAPRIVNRSEFLFCRAQKGREEWGIASAIDQHDRRPDLVASSALVDLESDVGQPERPGPAGGGGLRGQVRARALRRRCRVRGCSGAAAESGLALQVLRVRGRPTGGDRNWIRVPYDWIGGWRKIAEGSRQLVEWFRRVRSFTNSCRLRIDGLTVILRRIGARILLFRRRVRRRERKREAFFERFNV